MNVRRLTDLSEEGYSRMPVRGNHSRVGVSPPSAAAMTRQNEYIQRPRLQSGYNAGSSPLKDYEGRSLVGPKSKSVKLPKDAYRPGMIIRAIIHEPNLDQAYHSSSITADDRTVTDTLYGRISSKVRHLIVIATYQNHYTAIPLYTHNGHGLDRKSKPNEYVSLQDHRRTGPFKQLSVHYPLVTETLHPDIALFDPVTTAHIPYIISRGYILPVVHEGSLEAESTRNLLKLVRTFC